MYPNEQYMATAVIHDRRRVPWLTIGGYTLAALALGIAVAVTILFLSYRTATSAQMRQLSHEVANAESAAQTAGTRSAGSVKSLSGRVTSLENAMVAVGQFGMVCSQDLTGANGPAQFDFPCKQH